VNASWIAKELKLVRNSEPSIAKFGPLMGTVWAASTCG
jgi:electron-transferring-flavoprotein dehydrogenase